MLKAIGLLKDYKNIDFGCNVDDLHNQINEAIAELEALQNRSCDNCLYFSNSGHGFGLCNKGVSSDFKIGTFYCNKWEPK